MNENPCSVNRLDRRQFLKTAGVLATGLTSLPEALAGQLTGKMPDVAIKDLRIEKGVVIEADDGSFGSFAGSSGQDLKTLASHLLRIRELWIGKNPFDPRIDGENWWEAIYPGRAKMYAEGRDPLTGAVIANKSRAARQTTTGQAFMAFSTVDIALWDLRGKLKREPVYRIMGQAKRSQVPVYWRPGEAGSPASLDQPRAQARRTGEGPGISKLHSCFGWSQRCATSQGWSLARNGRTRSRGRSGQIKAEKTSRDQCASDQRQTKVVAAGIIADEAHGRWQSHSRQISDCVD
jgi:hypothetical protein